MNMSSTDTRKILIAVLQAATKATGVGNLVEALTGFVSDLSKIEKPKSELISNKNILKFLDKLQINYLQINKLNKFFDDVKANHLNYFNNLNEDFKLIIEKFSNAVFLKYSEIKELIEGELVYPDVHSEWYWHRLINKEVAFKPLFEKLNDKQLIAMKDGFIGRDEEISKFLQYLGDDTDEHVFYITGRPGCGKSRFLLEYARISEKKGWPTYFIHNIRTQILPSLIEKFSDDEKKILILWDDWHGGREDILRMFLSLKHDQNLSRYNIKLVLSSSDYFTDAIKSIMLECSQNSGIDINLKPIHLEDPEIIKKAITLFSSLSPVNVNIKNDDEFKRLKNILYKTEGYPKVIIAVLALLAIGKSFDNIDNIESFVWNLYSPMIETLKLKHGEELLDSFLRLMFIKTILSEEIKLTKLDNIIPSFKKHRKILIQENYIDYDENNRSFTFNPDIAREVVLIKYLNPEQYSSLWSEEPKDGLFILLESFFPFWAWQIVPLLSNLSNSVSNSILKDIISKIDCYIQNNSGKHYDIDVMLLENLLKLCDVRRYASLIHKIVQLARIIYKRQTVHDLDFDENYIRILAISTYNKKYFDVKRICFEIRKVASKYKNLAKIDIILSMVLASLSSRSEKLEDKIDIANEINEISLKYDPPNDTIDLQYATVLFEAAFSIDDGEKRKIIADLLKKAAQKYHPREKILDLFHSIILSSNCLLAKDLNELKTYINELETISEKYKPATKEIDIKWVESLQILFEWEQNIDKGKIIIDKIKYISRKQSSPCKKIDIILARLMYTESDLESIAGCLKILSELKEISDKYSEPIKEIDYLVGLNLLALLAQETNIKNIKKLNEELKKIYKKYNDPLIEIDFLILAEVRVNLLKNKAVDYNRITKRVFDVKSRYNESNKIIDYPIVQLYQKIIEKNPNNNKNLLNEIEKISISYNPPDIEIDTEYLKAIITEIMREEKPSRKITFLNRINRVSLRYKEPVEEIGIFWVKVLSELTNFMKNPNYCMNVIRKIEKLIHKYKDKGSIIFDILLARGYRNLTRHTNEVKFCQISCKEIFKITQSYSEHIRELDLPLVQALHNTFIHEDKQEMQDALIKETFKISSKYKPPDEEIDILLTRMLSYKLSNIKDSSKNLKILTDMKTISVRYNPQSKNIDLLYVQSIVMVLKEEPDQYKKKIYADTIKEIALSYKNASEVGACPAIS